MKPIVTIVALISMLICGAIQATANTSEGVDLAQLND